MTFGMIISTVFEIALVAFTLWALFHEDRFAAFEQRLFAHIRRRKFRVIEGNFSHNNITVRER